jgi:methylmalonyl-CoA mutase
MREEQESPSTASMDLWRSRVEAELKGKPFESLLHRIGQKEIHPLYFDHPNISPPNQQKGWTIHEEFEILDAKNLNTAILSALEGGAQSIGIAWIKGKMQEVLKDVMPEYIQIHLRQITHFKECLEEMTQVCLSRGLSTSQWKGSIDLNSHECTAEDILELHKTWKEGFNGLRFFAIDSSELHNAGADATAELISLLWRSNTTLEKLTAAGISPDDSSAMMHWRAGIGTDFLSETSKFRAWRVLWDALIRAYEPKHSCSNNTMIHAHMSHSEFSMRDTHNNLLRISTGVLSAIIGGADLVSADAYTYLHGNVSDADRRITRNVQHLLSEECNVQSHSDAADGAYYFEKVTAALAEDAWMKFTEFVISGEDALNHYFRESINTRKDEIISGKRIIIGSNKYVDVSHPVYASADARHICAVVERT